MIKEYRPQKNYLNKAGLPFHKYGTGAFCKFSINPKWTNVAGVYAFFINDELVYIGQCEDLTKRINSGYGNISPRACYINGQSTNCKINQVVLDAIKNDKEVSLYFYKTTHFHRVEYELIRFYQPKFNDQLYLRQPHSQTKASIAFPQKREDGITESARKYIREQINIARENGFSELVLTARDIHRELGLENRFPCVCAAMRDINGVKCEEIYTPPKGKGARLEIKYYL